MLSLGTPLALLGLLGLPVLRWLHRGGPQRRAVPVVHLALWRGAAARPAAGGTRRPPDPAWRRRALLAALLCLALAEPIWTDPRHAVTLWVDDSVSMLTREPDGTRLAAGLAQARAQLAALQGAELEVRSLTDPWRRRSGLGDDTLAALATGVGQGTPAAPPAALLRPGRAHWLLTDGAHAALQDWPDGRRADRVIPVGRVNRNVGLQRLSARRSSTDPTRIDLLLRLDNGGNAAEMRTLAVFADGREVARLDQQLDAGRSAVLTFDVPAAARVHATLQPGDALAEDDQIALDLAALRRRRVAGDAGCPAALLAAVRSHPGLALVPAGSADADARLDCGGTGAAAALPTLRLRADRTPTPARGAPRWSSAVDGPQRVRLDDTALALVAGLQPGPADSVLLALGDAPAIVRRAGSPPLIETALDAAAPQLSRSPALPLLVNSVFEQLLGTALLDPIALHERDPQAARVVPAAPLSASAAATPAATEADAAGHRHDGTALLLWLALAVLGWEIVALGRAWRRLAGPGGAASA